MELKEFTETIIREYLNEQEDVDNNITLYHKIINRKFIDITEFIKRIINQGLVPNNNGEMGSVIWFSSNYNDYCNTGDFVVSIEYNENTKEKYGIYYDGHNGYVHNTIPFNELNIIKIPIMYTIGRSYTTTNEILIQNINNDKRPWTPELLNNSTRSGVVIIYGDLFNKYVQPYINISDYISKLDQTKFKIVNVF